MKIRHVLSVAGATVLALIAGYASSPEPAAAAGTYYYARIAEYNNGDADAVLAATTKFIVKNNAAAAPNFTWPSSGCGTDVNAFGARPLHDADQVESPGLGASASISFEMSFKSTNDFNSAVGTLKLPTTANETRVCCLTAARAQVACNASPAPAWSVYYGSAVLLPE